MKLFNLVFLCSLTIMGQLSAKSWRVNNNPNTDADFMQLVDAHDAASDGDTIYVDGSGESYGSITIKKQLTIIGPGYFLDQNPNNPVSNSAVVFRVTFEPDLNSPEDRNTGAAGSQLIGMDVADGSLSQVRIKVNNILITKCRLYRLEVADNRDGNPAVGTQIIQNYFEATSNIFIPGFEEMINFQFVGNIVRGGFMINEQNEGAILHNVFDPASPIYDIVIPSFIGEIRSNILTITSTTDVVISVTESGLMSHNTAANGQFGDENNNNTADPDNIFVGDLNNSEDLKYQIIPGSEASNNAHDGTDRGAFGGSAPYSPSGQAGRPAITVIDVEPVEVNANQLRVRIIAVSNN